jgi:hypothetical protein
MPSRELRQLRRSAATRLGDPEVPLQLIMAKARHKNLRPAMRVKPGDGSAAGITGILGPSRCRRYELSRPAPFYISAGQRILCGIRGCPYARKRRCIASSASLDMRWETAALVIREEPWKVPGYRCSSTGTPAWTSRWA